MLLITFGPHLICYTCYRTLNWTHETCHAYICAHCIMPWSDCCFHFFPVFRFFSVEREYEIKTETNNNKDEDEYLIIDDQVKKKRHILPTIYYWLSKQGKHNLLSAHICDFKVFDSYILHTIQMCFWSIDRVLLNTLIHCS